MESRESPPVERRYSGAVMSTLRVLRLRSDYSQSTVAHDSLDDGDHLRHDAE